MAQSDNFGSLVPENLSGRNIAADKKSTQKCNYKYMNVSVDNNKLNRQFKYKGESDPAKKLQDADYEKIYDLTYNTFTLHHKEWKKISSTTCEFRVEFKQDSEKNAEAEKDNAVGSGSNIAKVVSAFTTVSDFFEDYLFPNFSDADGGSGYQKAISNAEGMSGREGDIGGARSVDNKYSGQIVFCIKIFRTKNDREFLIVAVNEREHIDRFMNSKSQESLDIIFDEIVAAIVAMQTSAS